MTDPIKQYLYLVVDREKNRVIAICPSASTANALSDGFINSTVMMVYWPYLSFQNKTLQLYGSDIHRNLKLIKLSKGQVPLRASESNVAELSKETFLNLLYDLKEISAEDISNQWLTTRKLANKRLRLIVHLERSIERYMVKHRDFCYDNLFYSIIDKELDQPVISDSIREYSEISGLSEKESIKHLKNKLESVSMSVVRMKAFWEKYVRYINSLQHDNDDNETIRLIEVELMGGGR